MSARFHEQDVKAGLKNKRALSAFLDKLIRQELAGIKKTQLSYIFCNDAYLLQMNTLFLKHDTLTDIITFDLSDSEDEVIGEIYISVERVKDNAAKFGVDYTNELHRVIFHGALHLCGFKDKTAKDKQQMRKEEDKCLSAYLNNNTE